MAPISEAELLDAFRALSENEAGTPTYDYESGSEVDLSDDDENEPLDDFQEEVNFYTFEKFCFVHFFMILNIMKNEQKVENCKLKNNFIAGDGCTRIFRQSEVRVVWDAGN